MLTQFSNIEKYSNFLFFKVTNSDFQSCFVSTRNDHFQCLLYSDQLWGFYRNIGGWPKGWLIECLPHRQRHNLNDDSDDWVDLPIRSCFNNQRWINVCISAHTRSWWRYTHFWCISGHLNTFWNNNLQKHKKLWFSIFLFLIKNWVLKI